MRKIIISVSTGFCGMDVKYYYEVPDSYTEKDIDSLAEDLALSNAEMYGIYPTPEDESEEGDDTEYSDDIEGSWVQYDESVHAPRTLWEQV